MPIDYNKDLSLPTDFKSTSSEQEKEEVKTKNTSKPTSDLELELPTNFKKEPLKPGEEVKQFPSMVSSESDSLLREGVRKGLDFVKTLATDPGSLAPTAEDLSNAGKAVYDGAVNQSLGIGGNFVGQTSESFGNMLQMPENIRKRTLDMPIDITYPTGVNMDSVSTGSTQLNISDYLTPMDKVNAGIGGGILKWLSDWGSYFKQSGQAMKEATDEKFHPTDFNKAVGEQMGEVFGEAPLLFGGGVVATTVAHSISQMPVEQQGKVYNNLFRDTIKGVAMGYGYKGAFKLLQNAPRLERIATGTTAMMTGPVIQEMQKEPEDRDWAGLMAETLTAVGWNMPGPKGRMYRKAYWQDVAAYKLEHRGKGMVNKEVFEVADKMLETAKKAYDNNLITTPKEFIDNISSIISKETGISYKQVAKDMTYILNKHTLYEQLTEGWQSSAEIVSKQVKDYYLKEPLRIKDPSTDGGKNLNEKLVHVDKLLNELLTGKPDPDKVIMAITSLEMGIGIKSKKLSHAEKAQVEQYNELLTYRELIPTLKVPAVNDAINLFKAVLDGNEKKMNESINKLRERALKSYNVLNRTKGNKLNKDNNTIDATVLGLRAVGNKKSINTLIKERDNTMEEWKGANSVDRLDLSKTISLYNEAIDIATGKKKYNQVKMENGEQVSEKILTIAQNNVDVFTLNSIMQTGDVSTLKSLMANMDRKEYDASVKYLSMFKNNPDVKKLYDYMTDPESIQRAENAWVKGDDWKVIQAPFHEMTTEEKIYNLMNNPAGEDLLVEMQEAQRVMRVNDTDLNEPSWVSKRRNDIEKAKKHYAEVIEETKDMYENPELYRGIDGKKIKDHTWQDRLDVGYTLKVMGKMETAEALRKFNSEKTYWQEQGLDFYEGFSKSLGSNNEAAFNEIVLAIDNHKDPNREKYSKQIEAWNKYMEESAENLGLPKTWKESAIETALEEFEAAKETKNESKIDKARKRLELIQNTDYVHIPLNAWFGDAFKQRHPEKYEKLSALIDTKFGKRKTISISKLVEDGILDPGDLHIRDIFHSYMMKYSDDMALKKVIDAGIEDGVISKKPKKGFNKVSNSNKLMKGHYIHPAMAYQLSKLSTPHWADTKFKRAWHSTFSTIKMVSFANPLFLPAYDIYQGTMSHGIMQNLGIGKAFIDVMSNTANYKSAMRTGAFSRIGGIWNKDYYRQLEVLDHTGWRNIQKRLSKYGKYGVDNVIHASSELAWSMDMVIRQNTFNFLVKKGYTPEEAGRLTDYTHGAYDTVPKATREGLSKYLYTPTFEIAMGKQQYLAMKGLLHKGANVDKTAEGLSKTFINGAIQQIAFDMLMVNGLGFDRVHFGYKYTKQYEDEKRGVSNFTIVMPTPMTALLSEGYRAYDKFMSPGTTFKQKLTSYLKAEFKSKVHPGLTLIPEIYENKNYDEQAMYGAGMYRTIYPEAPDSYTGESPIETSKYVIRRVFKITDAIIKQAKPGEKTQEVNKFVDEELDPILRGLYHAGLLSVSKSLSNIEKGENMINNLQTFPTKLKNDVKNFGEERVTNDTTYEHIMNSHLNNMQEVEDALKELDLNKLYKRK